MQICGLEITDSSVSLLSLKKSGRKLYVSSFAKTDLPEKTIENGLIKKPKELISALELLRKIGKPKKETNPYVVVALPESLVYLTAKKFPNLGEDKLREAIEINLPEILPGRPEEVYWGWQEISGQAGNSTDVLIVSGSKEEIKGYLEALSATGFIPVAIESFSSAAQRAFSKSQDSLVVSLESKSATLFAVSENLVRFGHSFDFEGNILEKLFLQTKKVFDFYKAEKKIEELPVLLLGNAATKEAEKYLTDKLQAPVKLAQEELVFPAGEIKSPAVLGAALRGLIDQKNDKNLSLLPVGTQESYEEKRALHRIGGITNIFIITCLLFIILFGGFWGLLYWLGDSADQTLANTSKQVANSQNQEIQTELKDFTPRLNYMKELLASETPISPIFLNIKDAAVEGISFTNISLPKDGKQITVTGNAQSRDALGIFKTNLEKSSNFSKVDLSSTNVGEANTTFTVNLTLKTTSNSNK